jgi:tetratricopeptide (TPR) repeat protein
MRLGRLVAVLVTAISSVPFMHAMGLTGQCPDIHLSCNKDVYYTYETIVISYEVVNHLDRNVLTLFPLYGESFAIRDQNGREYTNTLSGYFLGLSDTLFPNQKSNGREIIDDRYHVLFPGTYTCFLRLYKDAFYPPCDTLVYSDTITFTIVEPEGVDKDALTLYLHADSLHWNRERDRDKWNQARACYLELVERFPQTVYADKALMNVILMVRSAQDTTEVINACKRLIEEYSESSYFEWAFGQLSINYERLKDKQGAVEYLHHLIGKYPDSKIAEKAKYWLGKVEKWEF